MHPCYAIFKGARHIARATYEHIHEPLQVVEYMNGKDKELAVSMLGRSVRFPLAKFHGEWTLLEGL